MKRISRRTALKLAVPCVGATALAGGTAVIGNDTEPAKPTERILVGPFNLGDLYARPAVQQDNRRPLGDGLLPFVAGPDDRDVIKWLKECRLYVIDERTPDPLKVGAWKFADEPKVAAEGELFREFRIAAGQTFLIVVTAFKVAGTFTNYRKGVIPHRITELFAMTKFHGPKADATSSYGFGRIKYDIDGKIMEPAKAVD